MTQAGTCLGEVSGSLVNVDRLGHLMDVHFDSNWGTKFWIDRAQRLGVDPRNDVECFEDLAVLGDLSAHDLRQRPLTDYIPRLFHDQVGKMVLGQTGGTTGAGTWTAYREDEFESAFVEPYALAAAHVGFPRGERWLFIGPSGPHIIAKASPRLARRVDSPEPFSVDFDPRWARKLPDDSIASQRYAQHIVDQTMDVINTQDIGVLFATPAILARLSQVMTEAQRLRIQGVHYGGMALDTDLLRSLQTESFPNAIHLSGYGNTLLGCCLELSAEPGRTPAYFPMGERLVFETLDANGKPTKFGEPGQLRVTRLDETFLIIRLLERDHARLVAPPDDAPQGFALPGVSNPIPHHDPDSAPTSAGLY